MRGNDMRESETLKHSSLQNHRAGVAANRDGTDEGTRSLGTSDVHQTRQVDVGYDRGSLQNAEEDDEERALLHTLSVPA